jgi:hypothetical protein
MCQEMAKHVVAFGAETANNIFTQKWYLKPNGEMEYNYQWLNQTRHNRPKKYRLPILSAPQNVNG